MFKVEVSTKNDGLVHTATAKTARGAIDAAAKAVTTTADNRVRFGVFENNSNVLGKFEEVFWAWGDGVKDAASQARAMDKKSRSCGGR